MKLNGRGGMRPGLGLRGRGAKVGASVIGREERREVSSGACVAVASCIGGSQVQCANVGRR